MALPINVPGHSHSPIFFGGFHGITEEGIPRYIQDKYEELVTKAMWFTVDGMWKAAASGIVKGAVIAGALTMGVAGLASGVFGESVGAGLTAAATALGSPLSGALILGAGALIGAAYDISVRQQEIKKGMAEIRLQIRQHIETGRQRVPDLQQEQAIAREEPPVVEPGYWQNKVVNDAAYRPPHERGV